MDLEHLRVHPGELSGHPADLTDAGQEAQHISLPLGERPAHHRGHMRQQRRIDPHPVGRADRTRRRRPHHVHRMRHARGRHHRGIAQQP
ncbi:hypothetical protein ACVWXU_007082 [Streptomyces sp. TE33382]